MTNVLGKVPCMPPPIIKQTGGRVLDLELREFVEILHAVERHLRLFAAGMLMGHQPEAGRAP